MEPANNHVRVSLAALRAGVNPGIFNSAALSTTCADSLISDIKGTNRRDRDPLPAIKAPERELVTRMSERDALLIRYHLVCG